MKQLKKIAAIILAAAMMFTVSIAVNAGMFDSTYVDGYYNDAGEYYIRIGKFNVITMANIAAEEGGTDWSIIAAMKFGQDSQLRIAFDGATGETVSITCNQDMSEFDFSENAPIGARYYNNGGDDNGFVVFFNDNSNYLPILAESEFVQLQFTMIIKGKENTVIFDDGTDWANFSTNFTGLDNFSTDDVVTDDTTDDVVTDDTTDDVVTDDTTDDVVTDDTTDDIVTDDTTDDVVTDDTTDDVVTDDTTDDVVTDDTTDDVVTDDTTDDVVTDDTTDDVVTDDTASDDTATDDNSSADLSGDTGAATNDNKGSADTGAEGAAAVVGIAAMAGAAVLLSRKKR